MMCEPNEVLWLLRHGNREDLVHLDWAGSTARPLDPPLSADGVEQARRTGARLGSEGIAHIFTSPYVRCAQTAKIVAERITAPIGIEPGLGELNQADWSQGPPALLSRCELAALISPFADRHQPELVPTYPETMDEAFARSEKTARALLAGYPGPLLLVGHAVSIIGIVRGLTGCDDTVACPMASLFRIERRLGVWTLRENGDTAHLDAVSR